MECRIDYYGLALGQDQIRLIKLYPHAQSNLSATTRETETVLCELNTYSRGSCPPYHALSHAWQHHDTTLQVTINGTACQVAETVEKALRQLRHSQKKVYAWVDQVCINQADNEEKGHQVQQMHHIYGEANTVVAWIGMPFRDSGFLFEFLEQMGIAILKRQWKKLAKLVDEVNCSSMKEAFRLFCQRPYWKRLWIMQEFAVCPDVRIVCGDSTMGVDSIDAAFMAPEFLEELQEQRAMRKTVVNKITEIFYPPERSFVDNVITRRQRFRPQPGTTRNEGDHFFRVLVTSLVLELDYNWPIASDPRDRVFALLQLASGHREFDENFVGYCKTLEQVYHETTISFLKQGHIDVLSYCQFPKRLTSLPSWVADWSMEVRNPSIQAPWFSKFSASGDTMSKQNVFHPQPGQVTLCGVSIDTVREYSNTWDPNWSQPLDRTAAAAFVPDILQLCKKSPRARLNEDEGVNESWYGQGLCPSHVAVGDVVCVFYGGRTPYIVRPQRDGAYTLVGETYMHGIMYGEFLKGDPASEIFTLL
ncbi:hypothetical protein LMH87_001826 [Akanthomyces muscarius]|uniref:Heterokaryon incompatibility domain-containing protein n=1 Tax=Akanthomyces muscarius TaxID=2231603 RepID=A0A9W8UIM2_AKAMU|nr:hypothetical protein LMH87_001826 [Akanthomyces muscarius]KAJ4147292.1 hypothetical protein LMH87_001826 [Akanthomyces muscarius]